MGFSRAPNQQKGGEGGLGKYSREKFGLNDIADPQNLLDLLVTQHPLDLF